MPGSGEQAQIYIYESEYWAIVAATSQFLNIETGGDLYGAFTHGGMPVVWLASGPGPGVRRSNTHFAQDTTFTTEWQKRLKNEFGIQYIGSWHSHHQLRLRTPSEGDVEAAQSYARNHGRNRTIEIIVTYEDNNEIVLWPYFYPRAQNARTERWVASQFVYLSGESPLRPRLGADERLFSGGADWRKGRHVNHAGRQSARAISDDSGDSAGVEIPDEMANELLKLGDRLINADQPSSKIFVVSMALTSGQHIDAHIDLRNLRVVQLILADTAARSPLDITAIAAREGLLPALDVRGGVLVHILNKLPQVLRKYSVTTGNSGGNNNPAERKVAPSTIDAGTPSSPSQHAQADAQVAAPSIQEGTHISAADASSGAIELPAASLSLPGELPESPVGSASVTYGATNQSVASYTQGDNSPHIPDATNAVNTSQEVDARLQLIVKGQGTYELIVASGEEQKLSKLQTMLDSMRFTVGRNVHLKIGPAEMPGIQIVVYSQSDIELVVGKVRDIFTRPQMLDTDASISPAEAGWLDKLKRFFSR